MDLVPEAPLILLEVEEKVNAGPFLVLLEPNIVMTGCSFGVDLLNNEDSCGGIGGVGFTESAAEVIVEAKPASIEGTIEQSADLDTVSAALFSATAGFCSEEATCFSTLTVLETIVLHSDIYDSGSTFSAACEVEVILLLQLSSSSSTTSLK